MSDPRSSQAQRQAADQLHQSAVRYENVIFTDGEFAPEKPFRALQVGTGGDLKIKGLDGDEVVLSDVTAGDHSYGGLAIIETGTTATDITALF